MKKILLSLGVLSLTVFGRPGATADLAMSHSLATTPSVSMTEVMSAQASQLQLAAIGDSRAARPGNLREADRPAAMPAADGLPSTPVALASLLLIICILVGRRNGQERVD